MALLLYLQSYVNKFVPTAGHASHADSLVESVTHAGCSEYLAVHRWDDKVDAFRKVDGATQKVVLDYYYSKVEIPCKERPKVEVFLGSPYEKLLHRSPELKTQDTYLNQAYRYLTTGQTILHEVPPGSKPGLYYCGLPREEINALKTEQRAWIKACDKQALEAGAFSTDAYIFALMEITKKRNAELRALIEKHPPKDHACRQFLPK